MEAYSIADKRAEAVAEAVFSNCICAVRICSEVLLSGRGSEFKNIVIAALCKHTGIEQKFTKRLLPKRERIDGARQQNYSENAKKKTTLRTEWDGSLPKIVYEYNASTHRAAG